MIRKVWTANEIETLKSIYSKPNIYITDDLLTSFPARGINSIRHKAQSLGLSQRLWTDTEIELLKHNYQTINIHELCKLLPKRNPGTIRKKANELGLIRPSFRWTKEEDKQLMYAYHNLDTDELFKLFPHRSKQAVWGRAKVLDLPERPIQRRCNPNNEKPPVFLEGFRDFDFGYLAGLIDGEGHIGFTKNKTGTYHMQVQIANTDKAIIDWLFLKIPFANPYISYALTTKNKIVYHWGIYGPKRVAQFLSEIAPYLVSKKPIAERLAKGYLHLSPEQRDELWRFVKAFNRNGK